MTPTHTRLNTQQSTKIELDKQHWCRQWLNIYVICETHNAVTLLKYSTSLSIFLYFVWRYTIMYALVESSLETLSTFSSQRMEVKNFAMKETLCLEWKWTIFVIMGKAKNRDWYFVNFHSLAVLSIFLCAIWFNKKKVWTVKSSLFFVQSVWKQITGKTTWFWGNPLYLWWCQANIVSEAKTK